MKRVKGIFYIFFIVLVMSLGVTGCEMVMELLGNKPDLIVKSIELLGTSDAPEGVRLVFANIGSVDAKQAKYVLVFSADETISIANDTTVYEGSITLGANEEQKVDLNGEEQIGQWMDDHDVNLADGMYYLGAAIDTGNAVAEEDELNNELSSQTKFSMTGGGASGETLTMNLTGAGDLNGATFMAGLYPYGADLANVDPLAAILVAISSGGASATMKKIVNLDTLELGDTWYGDIGQSYDVYFQIDTNGNLEWDDYIDYGYSGTIPLTITMDAEGVSQTVDRADFSRESLPATFGVYSESLHDVPIVPELSATGVGINSSYSSGTSYEGSVELEANFSADSTREITFNYPIDLDLNASSYIVFAIDDTDAINNDGLVSFWLQLSGSWITINVATPSFRTDTGTGPGNRWDIYKVPLGDTGWGGLDLSAIHNVNIRATSTGTDPGVDGACACTLYFDDIHFE